ncbi:hypothetical protein Y032_0189g1185 [Ancylostoma ceylanicum]|uniref:Uncharacterized protein n=1 Tax=Ancylostoma ceylanicum TaxID=53326 RepID=A0A016SR89_9BILA|nr:hypothetical protein Y032_0189g1185 [Ancylostoma ceylanicum]
MRTAVLQLLLLHSSAHLALSSADLWTRRNLENGNLYEFDGTDSQPGEIARVRLFVTTTQVKQSPSLPVHILRIRWSEARNAAAYRVHCEANATDEVVTLLDREILDGATGIDERFVLPQGRLSLMCGVAAANSFGSSKWTHSPMVTVKTSAMSSPASSEFEPMNSTDSSQVATEDLNLDQLLKFIHKSHIEDLPSFPIERPPEVRIVVKPNNEEDGDAADFPVEQDSVEPTSPASELTVDAEDSGEPRSVDINTSEDDVDRDYKMLEEEVRRAIGADEASKLSRTRSLLVFGLLDRML